MKDEWIKRDTEMFSKMLDVLGTCKRLVRSDGEEWEKFLAGKMVLGFTEEDGTEHKVELPVMAELYEVFETALSEMAEAMVDNFELEESAISKYEEIK